MQHEELRRQLCVDSENHCRHCFVGKPTARSQCPPNTFRTSLLRGEKPIAFVFDKPNDNTQYRTSSIVPIDTFDDRAGVDNGLARAPSHARLLALCKLLNLIDSDSQSVDISNIHITNAVKCDVSSETGLSGRVVVGRDQADACIKNFLLRELEACNTKGVIFFGVNAAKYVLGIETKAWVLERRLIGSRQYWVMRVPHTSPESYNTHGKNGQAYIEPFKRLLAAVATDA